MGSFYFFNWPRKLFFPGSGITLKSSIPFIPFELTGLKSEAKQPKEDSQGGQAKCYFQQRNFFLFFSTLVHVYFCHTCLSCWLCDCCQEYWQRCSEFLLGFPLRAPNLLQLHFRMLIPAMKSTVLLHISVCRGDKPTNKNNPICWLSAVCHSCAGLRQMTKIQTLSKTMKYLKHARRCREYNNHLWSHCLILTICHIDTCLKALQMQLKTLYPPFPSLLLSPFPLPDLLFIIPMHTLYLYFLLCYTCIHMDSSQTHFYKRSHNIYMKHFLPSVILCKLTHIYLTPLSLNFLIC